jgi:hypothetical protein
MFLNAVTNSEQVPREHYSPVSIVFVHGGETWSLTLGEEGRRLRVFENRVLRKIFGPKRVEGAGGWGRCVTRSFVTCTLNQILLG